MPTPFENFELIIIKLCSKMKEDIIFLEKNLR